MVTTDTAGIPQVMKEPKVSRQKPVMTKESLGDGGTGRNRQPFDGSQPSRIYRAISRSIQAGLHQARSRGR